MKKRIVPFLFFSLLLGSHLVAAQAAFERFIFFSDTYERLQTRAQNANKPYFVYFYANWCMPAKDMNEQTFKNPTLVDYAMNNYLGIALDGESQITEGAKLAQLHNVLYYPTVLFFTPEGKLVDRAHGFLSATELLAKLRANVGKRGAPTGDEPNFAYKLIQQDDNTGYLFSVSARTQKYNGYGVQVGVFKNYRNVFLKVLELEEKFYFRNIIVYVKESPTGEDMFKIILGPFFTSEQAANYQKLVKDKHKLDGVLVELDDLDY